MARFYTYRSQAAARRAGAAAAAGAPRGARFAKGKGYYVPGTYTPPRPAPKRLTVSDLIGQMAGTILTPQQQRIQARTMVNDQISAQLAALRESTRAAQVQANRQATNAETFAKALGGMRMEDAQAIRDVYSRAQGDITGVAEGVGTALRTDQERALAAAQGDVDRIAPGGQVQGLSPGGLQATSTYLGGTLPTTTLEDVGDAEYARSLRLNAAAQGNLGSQALGFRRSAIDLQQELARQRLALEKTRPSLLTQAYQGVREQGRSDLATLISALSLEQGGQLDLAKLNADQQGAILDAQAAATRAAQPDSSLSRAYGYIVDSNGNPILGPNGNRIPVAKSAGSKKGKGGKTFAQYAPTLRGGMRSAVNKAPLLTTLTGDAAVAAQLAGRPTVQRMPYAQARRYLLTNFANDAIRLYGGQRKAILAMVDEMLRAGGWVKPKARPRQNPAANGPWR